MKKILFFIFLLFLALPVSAQEAKVYLDSETLSKGYTVNYQDEFLVGVSAQSGEGADILVDQRVRKNQPLPSAWKRISRSYYFKTQVKLGAKQIALQYNPDLARDSYEKQLAYWERSQKKWVRLETEESDGYLRAELKKKRAKVIALERKEKRIQTFDSSALSLAAPAAIVMDEKTGTVIYKKNINQVRSLASLTKMMTAEIFLESGTSFDKEVTMASDDFVYGNYVGLEVGDVVTAGDLFYSTLVASSNVSAYALARSTGMEFDDFIEAMNDKAQELGLSNTSFVEPSGLDENNKSTAYEYASLIQEVLDDYRVLKATTLKEYNFQTKSGEWLRAKTSNRLVRDGTKLYLTGAKTGFTYEAGYCLMLRAKDDDNEVISVVLGEDSSWARFAEGEELVDWALNNAY